MGCFPSKVHAKSEATAHDNAEIEDGCEGSSQSIKQEDVGIAPIHHNRHSENPYHLVLFSDDSSEELEIPETRPAGVQPPISITSSSSEEGSLGETASPHRNAGQLTSPGSSSFRENQSLDDCGDESVCDDWLAESSTTVFTTTGPELQSGGSTSNVATRYPIDTAGSALADIVPLPQQSTELQDRVVKDTTKVERRHAPLPSNKPSATKGSWLSNRYCVNDYIVLSEIGRGAHSEVRLCKHKTTNELFACKIMNRKLLESSFVDIKREVSIMRGLRHTNILRLYEVLDDPKVNKVYLIMELANRGDLTNFVQKDSRTSFLSDDALRDIARQVMEGLFYLHQNNHVHNDLKPSNILMARGGADTTVGTVKIADFGVSGFGRVRLDSAGFCGTPAFMAPELVAGEPHDGQLADCYALGATLFTIQFGRPPFIGSGGSKNQKLMDLYDQIKHAPLLFPGPVDSGLKDLISKLMHKDPTQRLRLMDALRHPWLLQETTS